MTPDLDRLAERVKRLERENRFFKLAGAVLACSLLAAVSLGFGNKPRTIEAEKIVLRDAHGRARLTIGTPATNGAALAMQPDDPAIWLTDEKGLDRTIITTDGIYFANEKSLPVIDLNSGAATGAPSLRFYDADGKMIRSLP